MQLGIGIPARLSKDFRRGGAGSAGEPTLPLLEAWRQNSRCSRQAIRVRENNAHVPTPIDVIAAEAGDLRLELERQHNQTIGEMARFLGIGWAA